MDPSAPSDTPSPLGTRLESDVAARRERLREELVAAAEEEAAAIVEAARQEITVTVRRARRDLRLIRAQLQLAGVEPRQLPMVELDSRHVARIAAVASLEDETGSAHPSEELERDTLQEATPAPPAVSRPLITPAVIVTFIAVLFVTGAVVGWRYVEPEAQPTPPRVSGSAVTRSNAPVQQQLPAPADGERNAPTKISPAANANSPSSSVIHLQTIRPVWMRIDVDGAGDTGHEYPAGVTKELAPARSLVVRAGDAGAVMLSVGDGPARPLGASGQVVTRRIGGGDAAEAASAPAATLPVPAPSPAAPATAPLSVPVPVAVAGSGGDRSAADQARQQGATPAAASGQKPAVAAPSPAPVPTPAPGEPESAILARHVEWLDAYTHGDQAAIAAIAADGYSVRDERTGRSANASSNSTPLQVSDVHVDLAGIGAVLTARLRSSVDGVPNESLLSEVWVRSGQQRWSLLGVRITPVEKVSPPAR